MSDRFASISSLLPVRPAAASGNLGGAQPTPPAAGDDGEGAAASPRSRPASSVRSRAPRRPAAQLSPRASEAADGGTRRTAFRLDPRLHRQLSDRAVQTKTSKGNVVLDAIEAAHTAGALAHKQAEPVKSGMFTRTADRSPASPTVLVEIRLTAQALREVDRLVEANEQPTRTSLLHAALTHYFGDGKELGV